jgi:prevent-host-death family protein
LSKHTSIDSIEQFNMTIHTFSSHDFARNVSADKRAALDGPVFITDRGRPAFALLTIDDYYRIAETLRAASSPAA